MPTRAYAATAKCIALAVLCVATIPAAATPYRLGAERYFWEDEWTESFWDGACEVKLESKPGEFKREIKCKDGIGAAWQGEWKKEFREGACVVKQDVKRDEFKEEVKCASGTSVPPADS